MMKYARLFAIIGAMKKYLYVLISAALVGCTIKIEGVPHERSTNEYGASGVVQYGFFDVPKGATSIQMGNREAPNYWIVDWSESAPVDSVTGAYKLDAELTSGLVEFNAMGGSFPLSAVADMEKDSLVNVNFLTTLATELTWSYIHRGYDYETAREKANTAVLSALHMPKELIDFDKYSLYGEGEGDAMLAAVSIVVGSYFREYYNTTAWGGFNIDTLTGRFDDSEVFDILAAFANGIISDDGGVSIRKDIEEKAPKGKVGPFEKYLTRLAVWDGSPECNGLNQGEMRDVGGDFRNKILVCSDSAWRLASKDDFDTKDIFNPDVEYGTMVDPRDGKTYRTLEIAGYVWMAENLRYADSAATENLKGQSWCYDDDESNCEVFGRLYSWSAAMDLEPVYLDSVADVNDGWRGICPEGWHVPNREFSKLDWYESFASAFMALGDNKSGFSLIPAGYGVAEHEYGDGGAYVYTGTVEYVEAGATTFLWTSDQQPYGGTRSIYLKNDKLYNEPESRRNAGYLRCVQDYEPETY